jgi:hypothetical protein
MHIRNRHKKRKAETKIDITLPSSKSNISDICRLPLTYSWSRKDYPLPESTVLSDHNRILQIFNVQLEDSGTYYCTVARDSGAQVTAIHHLDVESNILTLTLGWK